MKKSDHITADDDLRGLQSLQCANVAIHLRKRKNEDKYTHIILMQLHG